jgi:histidine ammonia-lyase
VTVVLTGSALTRDEITRVARDAETIELSPEVLSALDRQRQQIEELVASGRPVYGVSTGFGALANTYIEPADRSELQRSLIRSHAAGLGDVVETEVVRAMMVCRLRSLVSGVTGVRSSTALAYCNMINAQITPVVREFGSLGCSGDLAPLAHVALALLGEGQVIDRSGQMVPAADSLRDAGLSPIVLAEKEGLSLINGTDGMTAMAVLAIADLGELAALADVTASMSIQALRGTDRVFADDLQRLRPHPGQATSARNLRVLLQGSPIVADHLHDTSQIQDAYSLRCCAQVHGALRDTMEHATSVVDRELASAIDNPSVVSDGRLESSGNFHGAPVAYVLDFLAIPVADVASMAERRTDRLLDPSRSYGLPHFLAHRPGVDSGFMIAQYTQAGIVAE